MSETVGQAVERGPARLIEAQAAEFAKVLPAHVGTERFTRWCLTLARRPEILEVMATDAGRLSVMSALMDCASLGLEPGRTYHLVPFGGKEEDGTPKPKTVTGITDYTGEIELICRANPDACVVAMLVRKADEFYMCGANVPPRHEADWFGDRGEVTGGYAYADFGAQRYSQVVRMSEAEFLRHRAKARTAKVWDEWPEAMRLKTLVHQLRKWVSRSAEVRPR